MGCDYYINVYLEIEHINGISYYEFPTIRGYYCELDCGIYDSDDEEEDHYYNSSEFNTIADLMVKISLTPRNPVVIYENNSFKTQHIEKKYLPKIEEIMHKKYDYRYPRYKDTGTFNSLDQVIKITKKEKRYER